MKQILTILILWICTMSVSAQEMKTIFVNLPDSIEPLLTKVNKEDCVDFLDSGMKAVVKNRFDRGKEGVGITMQNTALSLGLGRAVVKI